MFKREILKQLEARIFEPRAFIQVLMGPRQVGKTTLVQQLQEAIAIPSYYASADTAGLQELSWIHKQWDIGRQQLTTENSSALLILDEIQKLSDWSRWVKQLWDEDTFEKRQLKVILLGSAPWLMQKGLADSLAGRFEVMHVRHWSLAEMQEAFGLTLDQYIYFGGYPGAVKLMNDEERWSHYVMDSLIETCLSRDILSMTQINKPALLRQLFRLSCDYSGQILSYQKMLGQLDDAGNTTTLAHYLQLLSAVGLVTGLEKYSSKYIRQRGSSPKLQVLNNGLMAATRRESFESVRKNTQIWGRFVESAVGAHLCNQVVGTHIQVNYWREGNKEVDFILSNEHKVIAIEVKSSFNNKKLHGIESFMKDYNPDRIIEVGNNGLSITEFLKMSIKDLF